MPSPYPTRGVVTAASLTALYTDPDVFPRLRGREFIANKAPLFSTRIKTASNSREVRVSDYPYPIWNFSVTHSYARDLASDPDVQKLFGFFNGRQGRFGFFFYYDEAEPAVSNYQFGTGNGTQTKFTIMRPVGAATAYETSEPVRAFWNTPTITVNGTPTAAFTIAPWGEITFTTAPANGAILRWSGSFLFVCRFDDDTMSLKQFASSFWEPDGLTFVSDIP